MRQLFTLHTKSESETHDTFKCKRCIQGKQHSPADIMSYGDTSSLVPLFSFTYKSLKTLIFPSFFFCRWNHYDKDLIRLSDPILATESNKGIVSCVFQYTSHMK